MDTSLNTHMKQNCKQIYFFFVDILLITPLLNCILVLLSYSIVFHNYNDQWRRLALKAQMVFL